MRLALFRMLDNDSGLSRPSANHANFGGFGAGIRLGLNSSHLDRPCFTHSPLVRVSPQFSPRRPMSPRMMEVDDMEGQVHTSSVQHGTSNRDVQMPDIETSDGRWEPATPRSIQTSKAESPRYPQQCHNCQGIDEVGPCVDPGDAPAIQTQHASYHPNHGYVDYSPLPFLREILETPSETPQAHPARRLSHQVLNFIHYLPTPGPPSSLVQSQSSTVSSDTIRGDSNLSEDRHPMILSLYYTCVDASTKHIRSLQLSARYRKELTSRGRSSRYHPYARSRDRPSSFRQARRAGNSRRPSLMDNISKISTNVWREARNSVMAPHRAEADAVHLMRDLYVWSEIVIRGMENGDDYESADDGRSSAAGMSGDDHGLVRIAEAARKICGWLRDRDACGICDAILASLTDLDREALQGENVRRGESFDTSSDGIR